MPPEKDQDEMMRELRQPHAGERALVMRFRSAPRGTP